MILMAFRHGLRAAELVDLRWDQVDLGRNGCLHVRISSPCSGCVVAMPFLTRRALRKLKRGTESPFVFTSERGAPFTTAGFAKMVARLGQEAKFKFRVHPHMLRHACGYALANAGQRHPRLARYLGHKNIQHTVRYTELSQNRFKDFWKG
jgi:integrase